MKLITSCSIAGLMSVTCASGALTVVETGTFTDANPSLTLNENTSSIPGFNTALGTLTGVTVEFTSITLSASGTITNSDSVNSSAISLASIGYKVGAGALPVLSGPGVSGLTFPDQTLIPNGAEVSVTGPPTIGPSSSENFSGGPVAFPSNAIFIPVFTVNPADFGLFENTNVTYNIAGVGANTVTSTGGSPAFSAISLTGSGSVKVTYAYSPIPEPSALLATAGLMFLGFSQRRRP